MKRIVLISFLLLFLLSKGVSCSCDRIFFCEYIKRAESTTAIKGIVIATKSYDNINETVYIKVTKIFRDDFGITDTIKVYGKEVTADCSVNVIANLPLQQEVYLAFGSEAEPFFNPDSLLENYYENRLFLCSSIILGIKEEIVKGGISEIVLDPDWIGLFEYPYDKFEERLENCSFTIDDISASNCVKSDFVIYPNPVIGNKIRIRADYLTNTFETIRIYNVKGQLVYSRMKEEDFLRSTIELGDTISNGLYFMVITCGDNEIVRKMVLNR